MSLWWVNIPGFAVIYTGALEEVSRSVVVTVTVWVPTAVGGVYRPAVVMVPEAGDPPTTESTDQITLVEPGR